MLFQASNEIALPGIHRTISFKKSIGLASHNEKILACSKTFPIIDSYTYLKKTVTQIKMTINHFYLYLFYHFYYLIYDFHIFFYSY